MLTFAITYDGIQTWELRVFYLTTYNYLTRPNDLGYPTTCVFPCFLLHKSLVHHNVKSYLFSMKLGTRVLLRSLIMKMNSEFRNPKWRMQYGKPE